MTRRLTLVRERLTELTTDDLAAVAGAGPIPTVDKCDDLLTGMYPTLPVRGCLAEILK